MMQFDYTPTRQQLDDINYVKSLPPEGALFEGYHIAPIFEVLRDGEPIKFVTSEGYKVNNSFDYETAVNQMQALDTGNDNLSIRISGVSRSFVKHKDYQAETTGA